MRVCSVCKIEKDLSEFSKSGKYLRSRCKSCLSEWHREHRLANKEKIKERKRLYNQLNKDKINERSRLKLSIKANRDKYREYHRKYTLNRRKSDLVFRFEHNIRSLIYESFKRKGFKKTSKTAKIIGCSFEYLIEHLLLSYEQNYNKPYNLDENEAVHIDHIIPLYTGNTEEEVIKLCHYSNLQLLNAHDNLMKSNKLNWKCEL